MEFGGQLLRRPLPQGRFEKPAGFPALGAGEALGLDFSLPLRRNGDFDWPGGLGG